MNMEACTIDGHQLAFHRSGAGSSILLVHGITTASFIWRNIIPSLAKMYDVIAVDLLGCGDSDKPLDVDYSIKHHVEILRQFMINLGIERFHYIGHDLGGGIGQIFAVRYPGMLHSLTLINTVAYNFWPVQPIIAMRTPVIRQFIMGLLDLGTLKLLIKRGVYYKDRVTRELLDLYWKPLNSPEGRKAFLHFAKCLENDHLMEIADDLRRLIIPVQIIRGDADAYLSPEIAKKLHAEIPGSKLVRIPTGGHYIQEDEPLLLSEHILTFLEEHDPA